MKPDWLLDEPRSNYRLKIAPSNLASQSPFLAGVARAIASHNENSWDFWAARLGLKGAWRGFWARPVTSHATNKLLQNSCDPDVHFQSAELHGETV